MTSTLRTLLDRVEKGEGRDEELDVRLVAAFFAPKDAQVMQSPINGAWCIFDGTDRNGRPRLWEHRPLGYQPSPTSSIDAAVALIEKVLPNEMPDAIHAAWSALGQQNHWHIALYREGQMKAFPRALLAATLRAKIAQEGEQ